MGSELHGRQHSNKHLTGLGLLPCFTYGVLYNALIAVGWKSKCQNGEADDIMLNVSRGIFVSMCVVVYLTEPLMAGYQLKWKIWRLQYEDLHDLFFQM